MRLKSNWSACGASTTGSKPLYTSQEICEDLGISINKFRSLFRIEGAPKPVMNRNTGTRKSYYDREEFRKWYKSLDTNANSKPITTANSL